MTALLNLQILTQKFATMWSKLWWQRIGQLRKFYHYVDAKVANSNLYLTQKLPQPPNPFPDLLLPYKDNMYLLEMRVGIFLIICKNLGPDIAEDLEQFLK